MRGVHLRRLGIALATAALCGCATGPTCKIEVVGVEKWEKSGRGVDVAYRVRGEAGTPGTVWLVAKNPSGGYVAGYEVEVGPGPFQAVIDLKLTGVPESFVTMLEIETGRRCKAEAKKPGP